MSEVLSQAVRLNLLAGFPIDHRNEYATITQLNGSRHMSIYAQTRNPRDIQYLSASDLYNLNFTVTNGDTLVRDHGSLSYAVRRPSIILFGEPQFPTLADKAAAYLHSVAHHHIFIDGNKRTAVHAVEMFLEKNGYRATWNKAAEYPFVLEIAQGRHEVEAVAEWLAKYIEVGLPDQE